MSFCLSVLYISCKISIEYLLTSEECLFQEEALFVRDFSYVCVSSVEICISLPLLLFLWNLFKKVWFFLFVFTCVFIYLSWTISTVICFCFFYESLLARSSLINSLYLCLLFLLILLSHTLFRGLLFTYFIPLYFSAYVWFNSEVYLGTKIVL